MQAVPTAPAGVLSSHKAQQAGSVLFATNCTICHGVNRDGYGQRREGMTPAHKLDLAPMSDPASAGRRFVLIRDGVPGTAMPSWRMFGDEKIWQVVAYIIASNSGGQTRASQ
jgi:mono/diheme cytochrome c family protein